MRPFRERLVVVAWWLALPWVALCLLAAAGLLLKEWVEDRYELVAAFAAGAAVIFLLMMALQYLVLGHASPRRLFRPHLSLRIRGGND